MPKSLVQMQNWLKTPEHIRRILVDIDGVVDARTSAVVGTTRISNGAYTTLPTDVPANFQYNPVILGGVSFSESFSLDGNLSRSYGDIELDNSDGRLDNSYLNYIFTNKTITIRLGDPSWSLSDFKVIFRGTVVDIASRDRNTLNLIISDKLEQLNTTLSETSIINADKNNSKELVPVSFGECFNVTPLLTNKATLEYQVHTGPIEDIIEVRDNGLPVAAITKNLANGKFTLSQSQYGQITCSVQGDKPASYTNTIPGIITNILTNYGPASTRLSTSDIDFSEFNSLYVTQPAVGYYANSTQNVLNVCNELASSVRAKLTTLSGIFDNDNIVGKVKLIVFKKTGTSTATITNSDIEEHTLSISEKLPVKAATKIAYCKNYTVQQSGLALGLPPQHVSLFDSEWLYASTINTTTATQYKQAQDVEQENTLLLTLADAQAEANTRNSIQSSANYIFNMTGYAHLLHIQLGDRVTLVNRRYELTAGKVGTVVSISKDWIRGRVEIGVMV